MTERTRRRTLSLWLVSGALTLLYLETGIPKLVGVGPAFGGFCQLGFPDHFRVLIGALEVAGAIGLLVPRMATWAAGGLALLMLGALGTHLATGMPATGLALGALVLLAGVARERRDDALFLDASAPLAVTRS